MKTARDWVSENSQSGPFDCVESCADAEVLVRAIQADALRHAAQLVQGIGPAPKFIEEEAERVTNNHP